MSGDALTRFCMHRSGIITVVALFVFFAFAPDTQAATLRLSPSTGVYSAGSTFNVSVLIDTEGQSVNAADATLAFDPDTLSVANVSRAGSIFNLWTEEPAYSNSAGTITFGGGSPTGYRGSAGNAITITFRARGAGTPKVTFRSGSVLAADGQGTNVLTSMNGGSYTINAVEVNPEPEYLAPANTPAAPAVRSSTHPDPAGWYRATSATLTWEVSPGVSGVRTLLDGSPGTIPTVVYEQPITEKTIEDLPEGVSYFHIQFRNTNGWGKVAHYRLAVDTEKPSAFTISQPEDRNPADPEQILLFDVEDRSPVTRYLVQVDGGADPLEFIDEEETGRYALPPLPPGRHTIIAEAFDAAGNSIISTYSFDIEAFEKPVFTEYPARVSTDVIPVLYGETRAGAHVMVTAARTGGGSTEYEIRADENGRFAFIPDTPFERGVYDITAVAEDEFGARSEPSDTIRIVAEPPGYIVVGSVVVSVLSVAIPVIVLISFLIFGVWYLWHRLTRWKRLVSREAGEAEQVLAKEFKALESVVDAEVSALTKARKGKLTKAESSFISAIRSRVKQARSRITAEVEDIDDVIE